MKRSSIVNARYSKGDSYTKQTTQLSEITNLNGTKIIQLGSIHNLPRWGGGYDDFAGGSLFFPSII